MAYNMGEQGSGGSETESRTGTRVEDLDGLKSQDGSLVVPLLPLAESMIFPRSIYPLTLQGEQAANLVAAVKAGELVALFGQKTMSDEPSQSDLYTIGTLARLSDIKKIGDGTIEVTAEGLTPARLKRVQQWTPYVTAEVEPMPEKEDDPSAPPLASKVRELYRALLRLNPVSAESLLPVAEQTASSTDLAYLVAATIPISPAARQGVLEAQLPSAKLLQLLPYLNKTYEIAAKGHAQTESDKEDGSPENIRSVAALSLDQMALDRIELENRLLECDLPPEAHRVVQRELERLSLLTPTSPDYNLIRTYLQWLADLPWQGSDPPDIDLDHACDILDRDHYGLEDVKQRIIEHLAVRKLRRQRSGEGEGEGDDAHASEGTSTPSQPVLCLVGPPGVGKTSLGRSIAEALNRPFVRISLGGVTDEAEIRGHRRTYLGALPGRIIQSLVRGESNGPVLMLDELDKMGASGKGDPTAALLDVLDPEQQREFSDHYIEVPFDVSCIFFLATANTLESVPDALRDRLEVIRLSGYTEEEKMQIALRHLVPRQMEWHALNSKDVVWEEEAVREIISRYTREAGVRQLEREIATVCRRVATLVAPQDGEPQEPYRANMGFVAEALGTPRFLPEAPEETDQPGVVTGVFWTPVGGDIMHIEALMMPGDKTLTTTGQLGDVMRESAQTALSYVRARAEELGIDPGFYEHHDIHLHIPSGAVAKDGPSAGTALAVALASLLTDTPVSGDLALTGEITLRGRVLPVGGIREKVLAVRRAGIHTIIMPAQNRHNLDDIPPELLGDLKVVLANTMDEVLAAAFPLWRKGTHIRNPRVGQERSSPRSHRVEAPGAALEVMN